MNIYIYLYYFKWKDKPLNVYNDQNRVGRKWYLCLISLFYRLDFGAILPMYKKENGKFTKQPLKSEVENKNEQMNLDVYPSGSIHT